MRRGVGYDNYVSKIMLLDEMIVHIDMLGALVEDMVLGNLNSTLIITI